MWSTFILLLDDVTGIFWFTVIASCIQILCIWWSHFTIELLLSCDTRVVHVCNYLMATSISHSRLEDAIKQLESFRAVTSLYTITEALNQAVINLCAEGIPLHLKSFLRSYSGGEGEEGRPCTIVLWCALGEFHYCLLLLLSRHYWSCLLTVWFWHSIGAPCDGSHPTYVTGFEKTLHMG